MGHVSPEEPKADALRGASLARVVRRHVGATRPMFLPASLLPVVAGSAWGWRQAASFDPAAFALALAAVALVHAGVNVVNDVADDVSGADGANEDRIHPFTGGSRFIQNRVMTRAQMARWGAALLAAGAAVGLILAAVKGAVVLAFGLAGVGLGMAYSLPPPALSARGLGEIAVAAGFGMLPFAGSYWLQAGQITDEAVLLSLPLSFWVMAILLVNEVPDAGADAAAGKRTLVVRLGLRASRRLYGAVQAAPVLALMMAAQAELVPWAGLILPVGLLAPAAMAARAMGGPHERLRGAILLTLAIHALGGLWLGGLALA